ncbi:RAC GTPase, putative [Entamoeba invadens IP1]|uniref:small monomeric GTPase n=1 Tax=Entamoeba invadens IP1 TaxID=370355 RepID=A0A0A1UDA4_ENTIV|nr:RAC GTPase, putative [Entamoeba invadens IP1]ELP94424.1 RAC GTPase, putative [Entamoeba invadens IP1]|eukprot:XP_004261195.1 RAC GTPase, putative [Entamoeba invadens IP1]
MAENVKLVVVGDGNVGKTCMLMCYTSDEFPTDYIPTVFDNYVANVTVDEKKINLGLWDTAGQEEYNSLRPLSYPQTDIFLLCFSVVYHASYVNVRDKWVKEVLHHCPTAKLMVIGTKTDLREDIKELKTMSENGEQPYTKEDGDKLAAELKAYCYMECSALKRTGLKDIFDQAVRFTLKQRGGAGEGKSTKEKQKGKCFIL